MPQAPIIHLFYTALVFGATRMGYTWHFSAYDKHPSCKYCELKQEEASSTLQPHTDNLSRVSTNGSNAAACL